LLNTSRLIAFQESAAKEYVTAAAQRLQRQMRSRVLKRMLHRASIAVCFQGSPHARRLGGAFCSEVNIIIIWKGKVVCGERDASVLSVQPIPAQDGAMEMQRAVLLMNDAPFGCRARVRVPTAGACRCW
jgi:hypothetical protein